MKILKNIANSRLSNIEIKFVEDNSININSTIETLGRIIKDIILDKSWTATKVYENLNYGKRGSNNCAKIILSYSKKTN